jgi:hypothetical protein
VSEILSRVPAKQLMSVYKVAAFEGVDGFLQQVASARGKLKRGGILDVEVSELWALAGVMELLMVGERAVDMATVVTTAVPISGPQHHVTYCCCCRTV